MNIKVAVNGALGRMGKEVVRAVLKEPEIELVAAIDLKGSGGDIGPAVGLEPLQVNVAQDLNRVLEETKPHVLVDFTSPYTVMQNIETALAHRVRPVVGTTGITESDLEKIKALSAASETSVLIAPNFAIGAILMMHFAVQAAKYLPEVEIIELHNDKKTDAPSGTAIKTAEMILKTRRQAAKRKDGLEKITGARGGDLEGIRIHSVRLPGFVAHQEVIFGGNGQTLTIRHDSTDRSSFMPGVIWGIKEIMKREGVIYGLENLLDL